MRAARLGEGDRAAILALRRAAFGAPGGVWDAFDAEAEQWGLRDDGALVAAVRLRHGDPSDGYAARFFPVGDAPALEVGRLCVARPDALRPLLGLVALRALGTGAQRLIGVVALPGLDGHGPALAAWRQGDASGLPPLAPLYAGLGATLSADAVADPDFGTTLLLATLDLADLPAARRQSLAGLALSVGPLVDASGPPP